MSERLLSGNDRLDAILGGGLPPFAVNLVVGLPGAGKTMLVQQYAFANATEARPALYLSTSSEPFDKIVRYGEELEFFDEKAVGKRIFYDDLGQVLTTGGLTAVLDRIDLLLRKRRPGIVVIDSFRALRAYADNEAFRRFLHELGGRATAFAASHFWVGEYTTEDMAWAPEFAVADSIVALAYSADGVRARRSLQILKLRGSDFQSGGHAYRLSAAGLQVYPRLADPIESDAYELSPDRVSSGIAALDEQLTDGYVTGSSTLVAGPTGTGKTLMGLHFIFNGARSGQPGIVASLQENPSQLERVASSFGWSFDEPGVEMMYASPVDLYIDEWVYDVLDRAEATGAKRILVDSVSDLGFAVPDPVRFREYLYSLNQRCSRRGISLMLTLEVPALFRLDAVGTEGISHLSDNVVLLQYDDSGPDLRRLMTVLKARATAHRPQVREFHIRAEGIVLGAREDLPV